MKKIFSMFFIFFVINPYVYVLVYNEGEDHCQMKAFSNGFLSASSSKEMRAVWLNDYAFNTEQKRLETIKKISDANLNAIFLIAPPINGNKGWSDVDDFEAMLSLANSKGLTIYAWVCNLHRIAGTLADFTNSSERQAQRDWALALLEEYELLDGIHFDYIRYNSSSIVNQTQINAIKETLILTQNALKTQYPNKKFSTASKPLSGEFREPEDYIPYWYSTWFNDSNNNDVNRWNRSGYMYDGIPTPFVFQQDPKLWVSINAIDFTVSMEYCYETSWWKGEVDVWNSWVENNISKVSMGLGYYSNVWDDLDITPQLVAQEIVQKIHYGRANNISGFSIFEFGEPGNDDYILIDALTKGPNAPFKDTLTELHLILYSCFESLNEAESFLFSPLFIGSTISISAIAIIAVGIFLRKNRRR
ncbi:MAG: hypothetical protein BAJALOKI1v1_70039 [Promethearchaeota archaeon]|nr:MAG: hypothetical protein BAJALOKI1v1_70039 [Candidatus Lokiarchaeota archaeon]